MSPLKNRIDKYNEIQKQINELEYEKNLIVNSLPRMYFVLFFNKETFDKRIVCYGGESDCKFYMKINYPELVLIGNDYLTPEQTKTWDSVSARLMSSSLLDSPDMRGSDIIVNLTKEYFGY